MSAPHSRRPRQRTAWPPSQLDVDAMSGEQFEDLLAYLFEQHGMSVALTPKFGDFGCDLVVTRHTERTLVQAKRWNQPVGVKAVQEAVAAVAHWGCHKAMVVTNSFFTREAVELAASNHLELWDRGRLSDELTSLAMLDSRLADTAPMCRKCGSAMVRRQGKSGLPPFYGCSTFPHCWSKLPVAAGRRLMLVPPVVVEQSSSVLTPQLAEAITSGAIADAPLQPLTKSSLRRLLERLVS